MLRPNTCRSLISSIPRSSQQNPDHKYTLSHYWQSTILKLIKTRPVPQTHPSREITKTLDLLQDQAPLFKQPRSPRTMRTYATGPSPSRTQSAPVIVAPAPQKEANPLVAVTSPELIASNPPPPGIISRASPRRAQKRRPTDRIAARTCRRTLSASSGAPGIPPSYCPDDDGPTRPIALPSVLFNPRPRERRL